MKRQLALRALSVVVLVAIVALAAMPVLAYGPTTDVVIFGRVRDITNDKGVSAVTPAGDPVDAAAVVELVKPNGAVLQSVVTSANGDYLFDLPVQPGVYTVRVASVPANYGAQLVGTRLNPATTSYPDVMIAAAFIPGVAQVPVAVTGAGHYGWIDFEYTAGAKAPDDCQTPSWSYIHGVVTMTVLVDGLPVEMPLPRMTFTLLHNAGTATAPHWQQVYRPNGDRIFFTSSDRGIFGVGIRYVAGQYLILPVRLDSGYTTTPGFWPFFTLNPCGVDNTITVHFSN